MKLVLSFFIILIFVLGVLLFKIRIFVDDLDFEFFEKSVKRKKYNLRISLYFLYFIKIASIRIEEDNIFFLIFKIKINKLINSNFYLKNIKPKIKKVYLNEIIKSIKKARFTMDSFKINLEIGTGNIPLTSILVGIISGVIASSMQIYIGKISKRNYFWKVEPNYKENLIINFNGSLKLSYLPIISRAIKK